MDFEISIDSVTGVFDITDNAAEDIYSQVALSVMIPKAVWWQSPRFGSRLNEFRRDKITNNIVARVRQYLQEATLLIIETKRASSIDIAVTESNSRINYSITAYRGLQAVKFTHHCDLSGAQL